MYVALDSSLSLPPWFSSCHWTCLLFPSQVTEETCVILQRLGYSCECRGLINVKGKGELRTYFVCTDTAKFQGLGLN